MRPPIVRILIPALALGLGWPVLAQAPQADDAPGESAADEAGDEAGDDAGDDAIVVRGMRLREPEDLPVKSPPLTGAGGVTRVMAAESASFVRCAGQPRLPLLHRIVDGRPETGETQNALHQHIMRNSGCFQDLAPVPPHPDAPHYGICNPRVVNQNTSICRTDYDRGFIYEQALRDYAPDLRLSRSNTFDHATMARFRAREETRNGARSTAAAAFFYTAACMVQVRPRYALALLQEAPGSDNETRLRAMLISDGAPCVGGVSVERVVVDPGQFRAYLAEAVYSWAVAVKRTDSLLPADATG